MGTFKKLEDINAWQAARKIAREIYILSGRGAFKTDFPLRDQIRRASVSIVSNIAEGFNRDGTIEFIQFLSIAKGSAGEVKAQLYLAFDQNYIDQNDLSHLLNLTELTSGMLARLITYLRQTTIRGIKYKKS